MVKKSYTENSDTIKKLLYFVHHIIVLSLLKYVYNIKALNNLNKFNNYNYLQ